MRTKSSGFTLVEVLIISPIIILFVGTFIASIMTHLWIYDGSVDESGKLVLDATGPSMDGRSDAHYQDMIEIVSDDRWILTSRMQAADGQWHHFMTSINHRI